MANREAVVSGAGFRVRFWGVRGSIAAPGPATARYGGNTSSLEVRCGGRLILLDAGTGLRELGIGIVKEAPIDADLYFTHTHFDHVCGLPFFKPFFQPQNRFRLWAGHLGGGTTLQRVMREFMIAPLFPVPPEVFRATMEYRDFKPGDELSPGSGVRVVTRPLNHPDGAVGYRIEHGGRSLAYITDTEHVPGTPDKNVLALMQSADVAVYDSMYTDEEYANSYVGWGHSTWQEGVRLAKLAKLKKLVLFHHDPEHDDADLDAIAREAEAALPGTVLAREGLALEI
jgi:phosphoribosyl 1,2-cyclic phosphodiesterase